MESRRKSSPDTEQIVDDISWTSGVGQPAGVYWIRGRSIIAAHGSGAERRLQEEGGILIATLRFDADPLERVHRTGTVHGLAPAEAACQLFRSGVN